MMLFLTCSRKVNSIVVLNTVNLIFCPKSDVGRPKLRDTCWNETCHLEWSEESNILAVGY